MRLPGNGNPNLHGARPVHRILTMLKWTRTSRSSKKITLSLYAPSSLAPSSAEQSEDGARSKTGWGESGSNGRFLARAAVERIWHTKNSQSQVLALTFREKYFKPLKMFPLRSEAEGHVSERISHLPHRVRTNPCRGVRHRHRRTLSTKIHA